MSQHIEWMSASDGVTVAPTGTEIGQDTVDDGNVALVFGGNDIAVVEGTPEEVRDLLSTALVALLPALRFRNVNEDGEEYGEHRTMGAALAWLLEFPNDTIVITMEA